MDIFTSYTSCINAIKKEAEKNANIDKTIVERRCEKANNEINTLKTYFNELMSDLKNVDTISMRGFHKSCIRIIDELQDVLGFVGDRRLYNLKSPYNEEESKDDEKDLDR